MQNAIVEKILRSAIFDEELGHLTAKVIALDPENNKRFYVFLNIDNVETENDLKVMAQAAANRALKQYRINPVDGYQEIDLGG